MESTTLVIIIWGAMSVWTWSIAKKNGRGEIQAAVLGLLLGIFAVIGYALAGATEKVKRQRAKELLEDIK